jgi:4-hydroxybenzoate polyprenyltransferase
MLNSLYIYQKERFPLLINLILIGALTYSTISYSRNITDIERGIETTTFIAILVITFTTFFLIRLIDEFKDYDIDKEHRPHLPVQRGVVSLSTLKAIIVALLIIQLVTIIFFIPQLWIFYLIIMTYLFFMSFEFFISEKIEKLPIIYMVSHMVIVPLIDLFASTGDWYINNSETHWGLYLLLATSFFNGMVIEFGRKIKAKENEEYNSYTRKYGIKKTIAIWLSVLFITLCFSSACCIVANYSFVSIIILTVVALFCAFYGLKFIKNETLNESKMIEKLSGVWTLVMYITIGCYPQLISLFN